jgi:phosphoribosyl 1,2-cyclic phosphodiesterase
MCLRAAEVGLTLDDLDAVFVTHEHGDHVQGLGTLTRKHKVPAYMTAGTFENLPKNVGELPKVELIEAGDSVEIRGLKVSSFSVTHDAADPVSYVAEFAGRKLGIAGDLGKPSTLVRNRLAGAHALVLESNYCPQMLRKSSYPPRVLQRISGRHGHMSNADMCSLLSNLMHDALQQVVLVHISQENNTPELARSMAARVLHGHEADLHIASQDHATPLFEIGA